MRHAVALAVLVASWALLALVRVPREAERLRAVAGEHDVAWTALALDSEASWHLRRVELLLASGRPTTRDRALDAPAGRAVPWPNGLTLATAALAQRFHARPDGPPDVGGVPEEALLGLAVHLPVFVALATVTLLALGAWPRARRGERGREPWTFALVLPLFAWLAPYADPGAFGPAPFAALFGLAFALALVRVHAAREPSDWALGALVAGGLIGAGVGFDLAVLPVLVAACAWTALAAARAKPERSRDLTRAGLLIVGAALAFFTLAASTRGSGPRAGAAAFPLVRCGLALCLFPLAGRIVAGTRAPVVALGLIAPFVVATFDEHLRGAFAPELVRAARPGLVALGATLGAFALLRAVSPERPTRPVARAVTALLAVVVGAACLRGANDAPSRAALERRASALRLATELRRLSPSPGPWNDPGARPDWVTLVPRELEGVVLLHARRAVRSYDDPAAARWSRDERFLVLDADFAPTAGERRLRAGPLALWERPDEAPDAPALAPR